MNATVFDLVRAACVLEATAVKAGNVHPTASFSNTTYDDFVLSADLVRKTFEEHSDAPIGVWIYESVRTVREQLGKNTNLGIILLLAPLAKAAINATPNCNSSISTHRVLGDLTSKDTALVYKAIALANPGGLGESSEMDIHQQPPSCLISAMQLAADYDDVARQYVTNFRDVYELAERLAVLAKSEHTILDAISRLQLERLGQSIDTLILRKRGKERAFDVQQHARVVLESGPFGSEAFRTAWLKLDQYLRSDGNKLNPGTTADLLAAAIFVYLFQNPKAYESTTIPS